jgi:uncharacterized membrane protein SpoIIM required for sporulation
MTEAAFIKANLQRWQNFEQILKNPSGKNPDKLKTLYLQLTDDVAYADTYFANGEITAYLHNLAGQVHKRVYRNKKNKSNRFADFWVKEVPEVSYRHRKQLLYALVVFSLSMLIGIFSAQQDENFVRLILGDTYVTMTEENIANEDPMAVYKSMGQNDMFFAITFNNIRVSFIAFAFGLLSAVGTGFIMLQNGIMVGAFQFYFYQKGLFLTSFLTIWIHGTLEISAIIIAGAAGMIMGNGLFFPGSYPRAESFKRAAKDALKLAIGLVPIFITAGFLESFVTRQTEMHMALKILIIGGSAAFIIFYFVIYPKKLRSYGIIKP